MARKLEIWRPASSKLPRWGLGNTRTQTRFERFPELAPEAGFRALLAHLSFGAA